MILSRDTPLLMRVAEVPAALAIWPPRPGNSSTLCIWVPRGMSPRGSVFPGLMRALGDDVIVAPGFRSCGARM
jgi:hypothetical protein